MFEKLADAASKEIFKLSKGQLHCLPYSIALQEFFEARGVAAKLLVVRGIVFSSREDFEWREFPYPQVSGQIVRGTHANGAFDVSVAEKQRRICFRTIGYPHGTGDLGSYAEDGGWNGHLVNVVGNTVIDLTIGQLNDPDYHVDFSPTWTIYESVSPEFLAGKKTMVRIVGGMLVILPAYPDEKTHEQSRSWIEAEKRQELKDVAARLIGEFKDQPDEAFHGEMFRKSVTRTAAVAPPARQGKVGRNDPCPCGCGKKYKKCCGR